MKNQPDFCGIMGGCRKNASPPKWMRAFDIRQGYRPKVLNVKMTGYSS